MGTLEVTYSLIKGMLLC